MSLVVHERHADGLLAHTSASGVISALGNQLEVCRRNWRETTMHCGSMKHAHFNGSVLLHGNYHPLRSL